MIDTALMPTMELLDHTVHAILETMFFVEPEEPVDNGLEEALLWTEVKFTGAHQGVLVVGLSNASAMSMAGDLLGDVEDGDGVGPEVLRELANIICGALLSAWQTDSLFDLNAPLQLDARPNGSFSLTRDYILPDGRLVILLDIRL